MMTLTYDPEVEELSIYLVSLPLLLPPPPNKQTLSMFSVPLIILQHLINIIYSLTARVIGAPQTTSQPVFPVLHCPPRPAEIQACLFPDVVFPPLPLFALSSSAFHSALQDGFGQT